MMNEPISSIMTTDLITLSREDTLDKVDEILRTKRIHHIPIVEGKKLVGLVTTYDLYKLDKLQSSYATTKVGDIMTTKLATLESKEKIGTVAEIFLAHLFHAVPIVDNDELVGIVTTHDVLKYSFRKEYARMPWSS